MTNLKPCPFCGGEATPKLSPYIGGGGCGYIVDCDKCWAKTGYYGTEAKAIEAWNTRACDECERGAIPATEENMAAHGWVRERMCEWTLEHSGTLYDKWKCSECGYEYVESRTDSGATELVPNYCPSCGAKVIDNEEE